MKPAVLPALLVLSLLGGCGDSSSDRKAASGPLALHCGDFGKLEVIDGFASLKLPDGSSVQSLGGDVRSLADGQALSAISYSDGSVLYRQAGDQGPAAGLRDALIRAIYARAFAAAGLI